MNEEYRECSWIGTGERCHHLPLYGKAYCDTHYNRVYLTLFPEMADYIIEKELEYKSKNNS